MRVEVLFTNLLVRNPHHHIIKFPISLLSLVSEVSGSNERLIVHFVQSDNFSLSFS